MKGYIICSTPRTGSTLLCDLLSATGVLGDPDSFFMRDVDPVWADRWGLPARGTMSAADHAAASLAAATRAGRGRTDVFGLRLMRDSLGDLCALIDAAHPGLASDRARLEAAFGATLFIHLTRADKLAQAVSMVRAEQTGLWHVAPDGTEVERLAPPQPPVYDFARIDATLAALERHDADWLTWFDAEGIVPLRIDYDSLSADPAGTVGRICRAMGVAASPIASVAPGVAKLADGTNADWMRRYRAEAGRPG